jgi:hypothetical protein
MRSRTYFVVSIVGLAMLAFMATVAIQRWASQVGHLPRQAGCQRRHGHGRHGGPVPGPARERDVQENPEGAHLRSGRGHDQRRQRHL